MPTISNGETSHNFITLKGQVQSLGMMLEDITRPAVNGHAYRRMARHGAPFEMVGHRDVDDTDAVGPMYLDMVEAYQGQMVSVVDDLGGEFSNIVCLGVQRVESFKLIRAVGGVSFNKGAMLVVRFTFQATQ